MHNLFLGMVKHLMNLWVKDNKIDLNLDAAQAFFQDDNLVAGYTEDFRSITRKITVGDGFIENLGLEDG